jgi:hypothetical protein
MFKFHHRLKHPKDSFILIHQQKLGKRPSLNYAQASIKDAMVTIPAILSLVVQLSIHPGNHRFPETDIILIS